MQDSPVDGVQDSKMDKSSIHEIVLVGGSTRIPRVRAFAHGHIRQHSAQQGLKGLRMAVTNDC
jgi:molecular chaperone DnaK (HSP70)